MLKIVIIAIFSNVFDGMVICYGKIRIKAKHAPEKILNKTWPLADLRRSGKTLTQLYHSNVSYITTAECSESSASIWSGILGVRGRQSTVRLISGFITQEIIIPEDRVDYEQMCDELGVSLLS